tara:strand:+ start:431 stop:628 length:198 start_codon:yes stop_codon:yes gene_type:complete
MEYKETELNQNSSPDEGVSNTRSRVDLNNLIRKVKEEEKKSKRQNIVISAAALSVVAVFGLILTL